MSMSRVSGDVEIKTQDSFLLCTVQRAGAISRIRNAENDSGGLCLPEPANSHWQNHIYLRSMRLEASSELLGVAVRRRTDLVRDVEVRRHAIVAMSGFSLWLRRVAGALGERPRVGQLNSRAFEACLNLRVSPVEMRGVGTGTGWNILLTHTPITGDPLQPQFN